MQAAEEERPAPGDGKESGSTRPVALPGQGTEEGDKLLEAHRAFDAGDYVRVRRLCDDLLEASDDAVMAAARDLRRRTEVDPIQVAVVIACLALFLFIAYTFVF